MKTDGNEFTVKFSVHDSMHKNAKVLMIYKNVRMCHTERLVISKGGNKSSIFLE